MTPTPEEKLFDYLSEIDDKLLQEAMELDSAEKLPEEAKIIPFTQRPAFRWTAAIAACLAILLCLSPLLQTFTSLRRGEQSNTPPLLYDPTWPTRPTNPSQPVTPSIPSESLDPPWITAGTNISIESADMLNYYSAIYLLAQQNTVNFTSAGSTSGYGLTLLDTPYNTEPPYGDIPIYSTPSSTMPPPADTFTEPEIGDEPYCTMPPPPWELETEYTEPPANTEGPPVAPSTEYTIPEDAEIFYYEFDPNATFHISKVIFFRIQLSGNGFLAQTLGTGIVDVVITDLGISEPMITLKNGDKYLSCLFNGGNDTFFEFSTHKYIEGFSIVKNFRQENYAFVVTLDGKLQADYFECQVFGYGNNPDGVLPIVGETYIAETDLSFTIDQLESYFQSFKTPI